MSDTLEKVVGKPAATDEPPLSRFEVVPTKNSGPEQSFSFRREEPPPQPDPRPAKQPALPPKTVLLVTGVALAAVLLVMAVLGLHTAINPKPPVPYIDLGSQRFDAAGLGGRLIARWEGNAEYELSLDPLAQDFVPGFEAVAQNPPRPLSLTVRLRNAEGLVVCQKEILFPPPAPEGATPDTTQLLQPKKTQSGDTVQNVAGEDGRIAEIALSGGLPCAQKAYEHFVSWDFATNFPALAEQAEWLKQQKLTEQAEEKKRHPANGLVAMTQHLPTAIEGDDVIVGDNPSHGTVETSAGRVFLVATASAHSRGSEWQVFPAAIHFRCDRNGVCVLSRTNSHSTLQARLLR